MANYECKLSLNNIRTGDSIERITSTEVGILIETCTGWRPVSVLKTGFNEIVAFFKSLSRVTGRSL